MTDRSVVKVFKKIELTKFSYFSIKMIIYVPYADNGEFCQVRDLSKN